MNGTKRKIRRVGLSKPIQVGSSSREASPEIRSLQKGRIQIGSVAPLLSRRAKILAMKTCYNDYLDDEEKYDVSNEIAENSFSEGDYGSELYDYDRHHRLYNHHRPPFHIKCVRYKEKLMPSSLSFPSTISTTQHHRTQPVMKPYELCKSTSTISVPIAVKSAISSKLKKSTVRCNSKDGNKRKKFLQSTQSGPITRSRRAALMDMND